MMQLVGMIARAVQETAQGAPAAHGEVAERFDLGELIMHHLTDSHEIELPFFLGTWHLPQGWFVNLGPLGVVDLAPTKHAILLLVAALLCMLVFIPLASAAKQREEGRAPKGMAGGMEAMVLYFRDEVVRRNIGHGADQFAPYILTLFFFILAMNLIGLVPWGGSATGNLAVTAGLAICSFVVVELAGMRALGFGGYMHTIFFAPPGVSGVGKALMLIVMTPVELMGKLTKPFALTIRLFANMTAGHTLIYALGGLAFVFVGAVAGGVAVATGAMALGVMCLELFVAFLQAYVFAMLTAVFIGLIRHAH
jgi:F-type H+-transporting ATPase subunit a